MTISGNSANTAPGGLENAPSPPEHPEDRRAEIAESAKILLAAQPITLNAADLARLTGFAGVPADLAPALALVLLRREGERLERLRGLILEQGRGRP